MRQKRANNVIVLNRSLENGFDASIWLLDKLILNELQINRNRMEVVNRYGGI